MSTDNRECGRAVLLAIVLMLALQASVPTMAGLMYVELESFGGGESYWWETDIPIIKPGKSWGESFTLTGTLGNVEGDVVAALNTHGDHGVLEVTDFRFESGPGARYRVEIYINCDYQVVEGDYKGWNRLHGHGWVPDNDSSAWWDKGSIHKGVVLPPIMGWHNGLPKEFGFNADYGKSVGYVSPGQLYNIETYYDFTLIAWGGVAWLELPDSGKDEFIPEPATLLLFAVAGLMARPLRRA